MTLFPLFFAAAAAGCGEGGLGGGDECEGPTEKLHLNLLAGGADCAQDDPDAPLTGEIQGVFALTSNGFEVTSGTEKKTISPVDPAIPEGTFVRLVYGCSPGFYGDAGAWVLLDNVDSLDGTANPTEAGARLWFFMTAGGEAAIPKELPFSYKFEDVCEDGSFEEGSETPQNVLLSGPGFDVAVAPAASAPFEATSGPHAGKYSFENVNCTFIGHPGGDGTQDINMRLSRAD